MQLQVAARRKTARFPAFLLVVTHLSCTSTWQPLPLTFTPRPPPLPSAWLEQGCLRQLVLVITEAHTKEVLERWTFDIETSKEALEGSKTIQERPEKEVTSEIQAIMRQITASVTFLPLLETRCEYGYAYP